MAPLRGCSEGELLWKLGVLNGWGYGRSIAHADIVGRRHCVCLDGSTVCRQPSCLVAVIEGVGVPPSSILRSARNASGGEPLPSIDVGEATHVYCPTSSRGVPQERVERVNKHWVPGGAFLRTTQPVSLPLAWSTMAPAERSLVEATIWPAWCDRDPES